MKKLLRRLLALSMAAALTVGMSAAVSAFTYPKSYWPLHDQWESISSGSDTASCSGETSACFGASSCRGTGTCSAFG